MLTIQVGPQHLRDLAVNPPSYQRISCGGFFLLTKNIAGAKVIGKQRTARLFGGVTHVSKQGDPNWQSRERP